MMYMCICAFIRSLSHEPVLNSNSNANVHFWDWSTARKKTTHPGQSQKVDYSRIFCAFFFFFKRCMTRHKSSQEKKKKVFSIHLLLFGLYECTSRSSASQKFWRKRKLVKLYIHCMRYVVRVRRGMGIREKSVIFFCFQMDHSVALYIRYKVQYKQKVRYWSFFKMEKK